jgi:hypothetical protein
MSPSVAESTVEEAALSWFEELGYTIVHGPGIAPGELFAEREGYGDVVLVRRLRESLQQINPDIPAAHCRGEYVATVFDLETTQGPCCSLRDWPFRDSEHAEWTRQSLARPRG